MCRKVASLLLATTLVILLEPVLSARPPAGTLTIPVSDGSRASSQDFLTSPNRDRRHDGDDGDDDDSDRQHHDTVAVSQPEPEPKLPVAQPAALTEDLSRDSRCKKDDCGWIRICTKYMCWDIYCHCHDGKDGSTVMEQKVSTYEGSQLSPVFLELPSKISEQV